MALFHLIYIFFFSLVDFNQQLQKFVSDETIKYYDHIGDKVIDTALNATKKDKRKTEWINKYKSVSAK